MLRWLPILGLTVLLSPGCHTIPGLQHLGGQEKAGISYRPMSSSAVKTLQQRLLDVPNGLSRQQTLTYLKARHLLAIPERDGTRVNSHWQYYQLNSRKALVLMFSALDRNRPELAATRLVHAAE